MTITPPAHPRRFWFYAVIAALVFVAMAPTLNWFQFSGDSEDLVVAGALEMRQGGPVWIYNLGGAPRIRKPPMAVWCTAPAISSLALQNLTNPDAQVRSDAYRRLEWQVRWPALAAGCLLLLVTAWLAGLLGAPALAPWAVMICATNLFFLRFVRAATIDVYLALFVTLADACFAAALLRGRPWLGWIGGGAALGLAIMTKGPVALVLTAVPLAAFLLYARCTRDPAAPVPARRWLPPLVGLLIMLAIALPWALSVLVTVPGALKLWFAETGTETEGVGEASHDKWYAHLSILINLLPWTALVLEGAWLAWRERRTRNAMFFALLMVVLPLIVLSFFTLRKERYLLPLVAPCAVLAAHGIASLTGRKLSLWGLWLTLAVVGLGMPLCGMFGWVRMTTAENHPWYTPALSIWAMVAAALILALGIARQRRHPVAIIVCGAAIMLICNALFLWGWSQSDQGLSEMMPVAQAIQHAALDHKVIYYDPPPGGKPVTLDLDIYLDQIVDVVRTPPTDPAREGITAMVMLARNAQEPHVPGWQAALDLQRRKHHWFVLVPVGSAYQTR